MSLFTPEQIAEWRTEQGNGMISAIGEYTPTEFWLALDEIERLQQALRLAHTHAEAQLSYPPCDTCGKLLDYEAWHSNDGVNRHLHACNEAAHIQKKATEHLLAELERMREALLDIAEESTDNSAVLCARAALNQQPAQGCGACGDACKGRQCRVKEESPPEHSADNLNMVSQWRPIETAPKDGTIVRLLVDFTENSTEDQTDPAPTIGSNNYDNGDQDEWSIAGWNWSQDCFTAGYGTPIGWLPMLDSQQAEVKP